jgi:O-antigen ligase
MSKGLKTFLAYSAAVLLLSVAYYGYVLSSHPPSPERETFLSEVGEGVGEVALWVFVFIYVRTALKLVMGKGPLARRLLPDYSAPASTSYLGHLVVYLDRSHIYFGVAAVALVLVHIALMGLRTDVLFFPVVLALVLWQGLFGLFLSWRRTPRDLRKISYFVHAQLITGVAIGVFAYFGHLLIDN